MAKGPLGAARSVDALDALFVEAAKPHTGPHIQTWLEDTLRAPTYPDTFTPFNASREPWDFSTGGDLGKEEVVFRHLVELSVRIFNLQWREGNQAADEYLLEAYPLGEEWEMSLEKFPRGRPSLMDYVIDLSNDYRDPVRTAEDFMSAKQVDYRVNFSDPSTQLIIQAMAYGYLYEIENVDQTRLGLAFFGPDGIERFHQLLGASDFWEKMTYSSNPHLSSMISDVSAMHLVVPKIAMLTEGDEGKEEEGTPLYFQYLEELLRSLNVQDFQHLAFLLSGEGKEDKNLSAALLNGVKPSLRDSMSLLSDSFPFHIRKKMTERLNQFFLSKIEQTHLVGTLRKNGTLKEALQALQPGEGADIRFIGARVKSPKTWLGKALGVMRDPTWPDVRDSLDEEFEWFVPGPWITVSQFRELSLAIHGKKEEEKQRLLGLWIKYVPGTDILGARFAYNSLRIKPVGEDAPPKEFEVAIKKMGLAVVSFQTMVSRDEDNVGQRWSGYNFLCRSKGMSKELEAGTIVQVQFLDYGMIGRQWEHGDFRKSPTRRITCVSWYKGEEFILPLEQDSNNRPNLLDVVAQLAKTIGANDLPLAIKGLLLSKMTHPGDDIVLPVSTPLDWEPPAIRIGEEYTDENDRDLILAINNMLVLTHLDRVNKESRPVLKNNYLLKQEEGDAWRMIAVLILGIPSLPSDDDPKEEDKQKREMEKRVAEFIEKTGPITDYLRRSPPLSSTLKHLSNYNSTKAPSWMQIQTTLIELLSPRDGGAPDREGFEAFVRGIRHVIEPLGLRIEER